MADLEKNVLDKVGKYNLSECSIISYRQDKEESKPKFIDIKGITLTMTISEDIFNNSLSGAITVYDTQDVRTILPLTGLERLSLKFNTPGLPGYDMSEDNGVPFQIYKVDSVRKDPSNDIGQFYKIFFCSPEMYNNQLASVSRAYAGPIEKGVEDIVRQKKYLNSKKPLFVEPTSTNAKYVIPSLKPYKAINFLATQSLSGKYHNAGYLFYETSRGLNFRSLESLLAMGGAVARPTRWNFQSQINMVADTKRDEVKDIERRMQHIIKFEFSKPVDTLTNIIDGFYANKLVVHDAFNKTIKTHEFNYKDNFEKGFHTETIGGETDISKMITPDTQLNDTGKSLYEFADSKKMVVTETSKVHNDYEFVPTSDTLPQIVSQKAGYKNLNLSMLVYGNTSLNVGDIINFTAPIMAPGDKAIQNPYTNGRYVILAIKHVMSVESGTHEMILRCYKDSVRTPLPSESDPLIVDKENKVKVDIYNEDIIAI
tara:strand:- start:65 stop:1516 length:1452 start_codon:yes stop_codon:yes gene_type:complete